MFFLTKMQEKGCVFGHGVYYSTTILENIQYYAPFSNSFVPKTIHPCQICKKNSMAFSPNIARERVSFSQFLQKKGFGFGGHVDTPAYKNQVRATPLGRLSWRCPWEHEVTRYLNRCNLGGGHKIWKSMGISGWAPDPLTPSIWLKFSEKDTSTCVKHFIPIHSCTKHVHDSLLKWTSSMLLNNGM